MTKKRNTELSLNLVPTTVIRGPRLFSAGVGGDGARNRARILVYEKKKFYQQNDFAVINWIRTYVLTGKVHLHTHGAKQIFS